MKDFLFTSSLFFILDVVVFYRSLVWSANPPHSCQVSVMREEQSSCTLACQSQRCSRYERLFLMCRILHEAKQKLCIFFSLLLFSNPSLRFGIGQGKKKAARISGRLHYQAFYRNFGRRTHNDLPLAYRYSVETPLAKRHATSLYVPRFHGSLPLGTRQSLYLFDILIIAFNLTLAGRHGCWRSPGFVMVSKKVRLSSSINFFLC